MFIAEKYVLGCVWRGCSATHLYDCSFLVGCKIWFMFFFSFFWRSVFGWCRRRRRKNQLKQSLFRQLHTIFNPSIRLQDEEQTRNAFLGICGAATSYCLVVVFNILMLIKILRLLLIVIRSWNIYFRTCVFESAWLALASIVEDISRPFMLPSPRINTFFAAHSLVDFS